MIPELLWKWTVLLLEKRMCEYSKPASYHFVMEKMFVNSQR